MEGQGCKVKEVAEKMRQVSQTLDLNGRDEGFTAVSPPRVALYDDTILARPQKISVGFKISLGRRKQLIELGGGDEVSQRDRKKNNRLHVFDGRNFVNDRQPRRIMFQGGEAAANRIVREARGEQTFTQMSTPNPDLEDIWYKYACNQLLHTNI